MSRVLSALVVSAAFLAACDDKPATPAAGGTPAAGAPAANANNPAGDFPTPLVVAKAFVAAAAAKDKAGIAATIDPDTTDGDLKEIRAGQGNDNEWAKFSEAFKQAVVGDVKEDGDKATVEFTTPKGKDKFDCVKKNNRWYITNF